MTMVNRRALVPLYVLGIMFYVLIINDVKVVAQDGAIRNEILMEVNKLRKEGCTCGEEKMPPVMEVTWNDKLEKAAAKHADDLFKNSRFSHMGNDGSEASDRVEKAGYKWSAVGENIGKGYATAAQVVNGWRQSPGHCRNMMDPSFREIGAARKGEIWVLNLGAWRE